MMLALEELKYRRGQFAIIAMIVALVAYLALMMNALGAGLLDQAGSAVKGLRADALVFRANANLSLQQSELSPQALDAIASAPGVLQAAPLGYVSVQPVDDPLKGNAAFLGFVPGSISEPRLVAGRQLASGERGAVLADRRFLEFRGAKVGGIVEVMNRLSTRSFTIVGEVDEGSFFFQAPIWGTIEDWRDLRYGSVGPEVPAATLVMVRGERDIRRSLPGLVVGIETATPGQAFNRIPGVGPQRNTANAIEGFGLVIGAVVVGAFFYVLTLQKVGQIGVVKAIGASSIYVFLQLLTQVTVVSALGLLVAIPLTVLTARVVPSQVPLLLELRGVVVTVLLMLLTAILGVSFSARKITSIDPLVALGQQQ